MVHRSMRNGSRVAYELYIKRVLMALEDFLFFSLYSFSCIAKQVTTLKQLRLLSCLVLSCFRYYIIVPNIIYAQPHPLHVRTWRPLSCGFGDTVRGRNRASLEMHLEAMIEWT